MAALEDHVKISFLERVIKGEQTLGQIALIAKQYKVIYFLYSLK